MLIHLATDNDIFPPRFGATQRTFGLARGLAKRHRVRALCVVPNRSPGAREQRVGNVELSRRRAWYTSFAWRLDQCRVAPIQVAARGHAAHADRLLEALGQGADVFAADLLLAPLMARKSAKHTVYAAHNVEVDHYAATHGRLGRSARWRGYVRALEDLAVHSSALTVTCTAEDAERMRELYGVSADRVAVIPNGWDEQSVHPPTAEERTQARAALGLASKDTAALFVGSDNSHNREALRHLLERVMPPLGAHGFRLVVVGSVARAVRGQRPSWLVVSPEVDDLAPWIHAADVGLNPAFTGGGSNVKLPTYLAAGLAVITTKFGLRGYPELTPHVSVAASDDFAEALRARPAGWAAGGRTMPYAVASLSWGRLGERLAERFESMIHPQPPPQPQADAGVRP
jgi:glycosyltransferase involved in cell wall biosynthesis